MSNRIDEILKESGLIKESGPFQIKADLHQRIRKAMGQYGLEQSKDGYKTAAIAEHYRSVGEIDRLNELVQAQKELIEYLEESAATYDTNCDLLLYAHELRNKIKTLEQ